MQMGVCVLWPMCNDISVTTNTHLMVVFWILNATLLYKKFGFFAGMIYSRPQTMEV